MATALLVATTVQRLAFVVHDVVVSSMSRAGEMRCSGGAERCAWEGKIVLVLSLLNHLDGI